VARTAPGQHGAQPAISPGPLAASPPPATTAVFHVAAAARPLLQAARHFSRSTPGHLAAGRLFPAPFSNERIGAAAANCKVPLPAQPSLTAMWQIRVTCTRVEHFGTRFDASFADDQSFDPGPLSAA
jgi:hypothetical protein